MEKILYINGCALDCALGADPEQVGNELFAEDPCVSLQVHPRLKIPYFTIRSRNEKEFIHSAAFHACLTAAENALKTAFPETGLPPPGLRIGCLVGTTGDVQFGDLDFYRALKENLPPDEKISHFVHGTVAERLVRHFGFSGPAVTISNTCVSGADAVLLGSAWIEADLCDMVLALGIDLVSPMCLTGFYTLGAASSERCRPFDKNRSGMNVGEGCGCVILRRGDLPEEQEKSFSRPLFRFPGGGSACDAYHLTAPHPEGLGLVLAMKKALKTAKKAPSDIAFVNAHGTGTLANDQSESKALKALFGEGVPFFSTKGLTGHTLGASGVLELIFTMLCLEKGKIPKSFGCSTPGEDIAIKPNMELREISGNIAMSTSLAFGGYNTALIVERIKDVSA